jgi:tRNA G26 N,N-dimethylase Trm1
MTLDGTLYIDCLRKKSQKRSSNNKQKETRLNAFRIKPHDSNCTQCTQTIHFSIVGDVYFWIGDVFDKRTIEDVFTCSDLNEYHKQTHKHELCKFSKC